MDGVPASTNIKGADYPRILRDNRVVFKVVAPNAKRLTVDLLKNMI